MELEGEGGSLGRSAFDVIVNRLRKTYHNEIILYFLQKLSKVKCWLLQPVGFGYSSKLRIFLLMSDRRWCLLLRTGGAWPEGKAF